MRATRRRHSELSPEERLRANARSYTNVLIRRGKLVRPAACETCGTPGKPQAHHQDYRNPRDVRWLCRECHQEIHRSDATR